MDNISLPRNAKLKVARYVSTLLFITVLVHSIHRPCHATPKLPKNPGSPLFSVVSSPGAA
jgi:hypothetical protein